MFPLISRMLARIARAFNNISFRRKLSITFGLVTIIPLLSFVYYSYTTIRTEVTTQTYQSAHQSLKQLNTNIDNIFNNLRITSSSLYLNAKLNEYLARDYSYSSDFLEAYDYIEGIVKSTLTANPAISSIEFYIYNKTMPVDQMIVHRIEDSIAGTERYTRMLQTYGNIVVNLEEADDTHYITLDRLLNINNHKDPVGILTIRIDETTLSSLMNPIPNLLLLSNEEGLIVSSNDSSLIGTSFSALFPGWTTSSLPSRFDMTINGEKMLVVNDLLQNGWAMSTVIPYSEFTSHIRQSTERILLFAIVSILLATLFIYVFSRLLTKRMENLLNLIRQVSRGNWNIRNSNREKDEIGQVTFAFTQMTSRLQELAAEVFRKDLLKKEAELNMLQAQINPHFLYNSLASISTLAIRRGDSEVNNMVMHLSRFYQLTLSKGKNILTLEEELQLTNSYLAIQQIRFKDLVKVHMQIDPDVRSSSVLKLSFQPFIENCYNHAIWDDNQHINIILKAYQKSGFLYLEIIDDGMGIPRKVMDEVRDYPEASIFSRGYGIRNVEERIKVTFGASYGIRFFSKLGIGTKVQMRFPFTKT